MSSTTKQHAVVSIQHMSSEMFVRNNVIAPLLLLSVVIVTLPV